MPTIRTNTSVGANSTAYPLIGNQFEYLPYNARVAFAIVSINTTPGAITATVYSGSDVLQQSGSVTEKAAPIAISAADDFLLQDVAAGGERLSIELRNSSGAALDVICAVQILPV